MSRSLSTARIFDRRNTPGSCEIFSCFFFSFFLILLLNYFSYFIFFVSLTFECHFTISLSKPKSHFTYPAIDSHSSFSLSISFTLTSPPSSFSADCQQLLKKSMWLRRPKKQMRAVCDVCFHCWSRCPERIMLGGRLNVPRNESQSISCVSRSFILKV